MTNLSLTLDIIPSKYRQNPFADLTYFAHKQTDRQTTKSATSTAEANIPNEPITTVLSSVHSYITTTSQYFL